MDILCWPKSSILEDIAIRNIYTRNNRTQKYKKPTPIELKRETTVQSALEITLSHFQ